MSDKRSVATDALATLGTIISDSEKRDAIHLAVIPAMALEVLKPGEHVTVDKTGVAVKTTVGKGVGIVDPFLTAPVYETEWFWVIIYPRTIQSLRHVWSHPAFPEEVSTSKEESNSAESWLRDYAENLGLSIRILLDGAEQYLEYGDHLVLGGLLEGESVVDEFWDYYQEYTGRIVNTKQRGNFFSCSC